MLKKSIRKTFPLYGNKFLNYVAGNMNTIKYGKLEKGSVAFVKLAFLQDIGSNRTIT